MKAELRVEKRYPHVSADDRRECSQILLARAYEDERFDPAQQIAHVVMVI